MAQILYRATDAQGRPASGVIEAAGMAQARDLLLARGLRDIQFQQEAAFGIDVKSAAAVSGIDPQRMAEIAVRVIERPGLATVLKEVWRGARWPTIGFAALGVFALWKGAPFWAAGALAIAALPFVWAAWSHRKARDYEQFLRAHATGDWATMRTLAERLRRMSDMPDNLAFDLDLREAYARIREGEPLDSALASLEAQRWRERLADKPGAYDAQVAVLHAAANRPQGLVASMRAAVEASGREPARLLDLALSEARCGDVEEAQRVLDGVDLGLLPPFAAGFVAWTRGHIALRRGDAQAVPLLGDAVREMLALAPRHPGVWISLALATADHARVLRGAGQAEAARVSLRAVWPILRVHAPPDVLADLNDLLPAEGAAPKR